MWPNLEWYRLESLLWHIFSPSATIWLSLYPGLNPSWSLSVSCLPFNSSFIQCRNRDSGSGVLLKGSSVRDILDNLQVIWDDTTIGELSSKVVRNALFWLEFLWNLLVNASVFSMSLSHISLNHIWFLPRVAFSVPEYLNLSLELCPQPIIFQPNLFRNLFLGFHWEGLPFGKNLDINSDFSSFFSSSCAWTPTPELASTVSNIKFLYRCQLCFLVGVLDFGVGRFRVVSMNTV